MRVAFVGLGTMGAAMAGHLSMRATTWPCTTGPASARSRWQGAARRGRDARPRPPRARSWSSSASRTPPTSSASCSATAGSSTASARARCWWTAPRSPRRPAASWPRSSSNAGCGAVDAPVSGGSEGAEKGTLTVFFGGEDAHVAKARPLLEAFCKSITHLGGPAPARSAKPSTRSCSPAPTRASARASPGRAGPAARRPGPGAGRRRGPLLGAREPRQERDRRLLPAGLQDRAAPQGPAHRPRAGRGAGAEAGDQRGGRGPEARLVERGHGEEDVSNLARVAKGEL